MLNLTDELFSPSAKHTEDERQRLEHTRVVEGDHGPGCGPIDLDSGSVKIVPEQPGAILPPRPRTAEEEPGAEPDDSDGASGD